MTSCKICDNTSLSRNAIYKEFWRVFVRSLSSVAYQRLVNASSLTIDNFVEEMPLDSC